MHISRNTLPFGAEQVEEAAGPGPGVSVFYMMVSFNYCIAQREPVKAIRGGKIQIGLNKKSIF